MILTVICPFPLNYPGIDDQSTYLSQHFPSLPIVDDQAKKVVLNIYYVFTHFLFQISVAVSTYPKLNVQYFPAISQSNEKIIQNITENLNGLFNLIF